MYAGVNNSSYEQGSQDLDKLADVEVGPKQVERVTRRIGAERCQERDVAVAAYQAKPLTERKAAPPEVMPPEVAVVEVDGGRLQILPRGPAAARSVVEPTAPEEGNGRHWREDKIGLLMTMNSATSASDPCPEIPENFVDPTRILRLARELKKQAALGEEAVREAAEPEEAAAALRTNDQRWEPPEVEEKRLLASRQCWADFAPMVATAAWSWGFYAAPRRAFLGDGAENNWSLWRQHFSSFVPIIDFIHALSYVFAAAVAGRPFVEGWNCYVRWIGWLWQGQVERVIAELAQRQLELGLPAAEELETSPRQVVARSLSYLQNHCGRMRYDAYRRQGLPITTSYVESAVKQFNQRVKGTEKFWSEAGAEGMLQLRADYLSHDQPLDRFWQRRQARASGQRRYRHAG